MNKEYNIGIYIRLSMADEDTGYGNKAESDSIVNQRMLINRFLDNHPDLSHCQRSEFADENDEIIQRSHERMKELDSETSCSDEKLDAVCDQYADCKALTYQVFQLYELPWESWHLYFHALCPGRFSGTGRSRRNQASYQVCRPL